MSTSFDTFRRPGGKYRNQPNFIFECTHIVSEEVSPTQSLVEFLKMLDDPTRLKILRLLLERELCVCQLVELLKLPQPTISQHLAKLRLMRLVSERKSAQWVYYSADREALTRGLTDLQSFLLGTEEQAPQLAEQWRTLATLPSCEVLRSNRRDAAAAEEADL